MTVQGYEYPAHFKTVEECLAMRDLASTGIFAREYKVYLGAECKFTVEM